MTDRTALQVLGSTIRAKREKAGLTQGQVARRLRVNVRQVQRWEDGAAAIPVQRLCQLAKILKAPLWVLVFGLEDSVALPEPIPDPALKRKPSLKTTEAEKKESLAIQLTRLPKSEGFWE